MPVNQRSHTRPILLSYEQATGNADRNQSDLRLPSYRNTYLARYAPYCRYGYHPRFDCVPNTPPAYNELPSSSSHSIQNDIEPPAQDVPVQLAAEVGPVGPDQAERVKAAIDDFFEWLATFIQD